MTLTAEQILSNFDEYKSYINKLQSPRKEKLLEMIEYFGERFVMAPASGTNHYHGAFPGGLVLHLNNVAKCSAKVYKIWKDMNSDLSGYTTDELLFCALFHDLGKVGDLKNDYFVKNESEWHRKNQGKIYNHNPNLTNFKHSDLSLFLLQHFNISISDNEWLAIKIHDGVFDDSNDFYFKPNDPNKILKNNLAIILHQADYMAYRIEYEIERKTI